MPTLTFKAAPAKHMSVSEYLRRAALPRTPKAKATQATIKPGRVVIQGAADAPFLTSADVASALYD